MRRNRNLRKSKIVKALQKPKEHLPETSPALGIFITGFHIEPSFGYQNGMSSSAAFTKGGIES
jgi:hypothetical protein